MLSPNQRNAIYKAVELQKCNIKDFKIEPTDNGGVRIIHKSTGFSFLFQPTEVKTDKGQQVWLNLYYTPSKQGAIFSATKQEYRPHLDSIDRAMPYFNNWLALIKQEFEVPDLWAELEQEPNAFTEGAELPEDAFTPAEIKLLEARIAVVEQEIIDLDLPPDTEAAITEAIREVPEKAKRLTKREVGEILFSTVMREGLKALLSKDNMVAVWHALYHLFTLAVGQ